MDSSRPETYNALVGYYAEKGDLETARSYVQTGLEVNPTAELYEINAKLLQNQKLLKDAEEMYLKAMSLVAEDDEKILGIKKQLIYLRTPAEN